jgi:hypothetical protein
VPSKLKTLKPPAKEPTVLAPDPNSWVGMAFMSKLLRRLMNEASGDILYLCIYGAANDVGITPEQAKNLLELAIKDRNKNNILYDSGFLP